jgi:hypothetical protein
VKTRSERDELRARVLATLEELRRRVATEPTVAPLLPAFPGELEALLTWTEGDRLPELHELGRIRVGWHALRDLGETEDDTPEDLLALRASLLRIQADVTHFYDSDEDPEPDEG